MSDLPEVSPKDTFGAVVSAILEGGWRSDWSLLIRQSVTSHDLAELALPTPHTLDGVRIEGDWSSEQRLGALARGRIWVLI